MCKGQTSLQEQGEVRDVCITGCIGNSGGSWEEREGRGHEWRMNKGHGIRSLFQKYHFACYTGGELELERVTL